MSEKSGAGDRCGAAIARNNNGAEVVDAPRFVGDFVCWAPNPNGGAPIKVWENRFENMVVNQGRMHILNRLFASDTASTAGALLFLHSASLGSGNVWSQISASQVVSYGASIPAVTFATTYKNASDSGVNSMACNASYGFSASTQIVSGAGILFYTSASGGTNLATADARLYCYGTFTNGSQQVQSGNTLSASLTVSFQSA
jgi:hypothetical protein